MKMVTKLNFSSGEMSCLGKGCSESLATSFLDQNGKVSEEERHMATLALWIMVIGCSVGILTNLLALSVLYISFSVKEGCIWLSIMGICDLVKCCGVIPFEIFNIISVNRVTVGAGLCRFLSSIDDWLTSIIVLVVFSALMHVLLRCYVRTSRIMMTKDLSLIISGDVILALVCAMGLETSRPAGLFFYKEPPNPAKQTVHRTTCAFRESVFWEIKGPVLQVILGIRFGFLLVVLVLAVVAYVVFWHTTTQDQSGVVVDSPEQPAWKSVEEGNRKTIDYGRLVNVVDTLVDRGVQRTSMNTSSDITQKVTDALAEDQMLINKVLTKYLSEENEQSLNDTKHESIDSSTILQSPANQTQQNSLTPYPSGKIGNTLSAGGQCKEESSVDDFQKAYSNKELDQDLVYTKRNLSVFEESSAGCSRTAQSMEMSGGSPRDVLGTGSRTSVKKNNFFLGTQSELYRESAQEPVQSTGDHFTERVPGPVQSTGDPFIERTPGPVLKTGTERVHVHFSPESVTSNEASKESDALPSPILSLPVRTWNDFVADTQLNQKTSHSSERTSAFRHFFPKPEVIGNKGQDSVDGCAENYDKNLQTPVCAQPLQVSKNSLSLIANTVGSDVNDTDSSLPKSEGSLSIGLQVPRTLAYLFAKEEDQVNRRKEMIYERVVNLLGQMSFKTKRTCNMNGLWNRSDPTASSNDVSGSIPILPPAGESSNDYTNVITRNGKEEARERDRTQMDSNIVMMVMLSAVLVTGSLLPACFVFFFGPTDREDKVVNPRAVFQLYMWTEVFYLHAIIKPLFFFVLVPKFRYRTLHLFYRSKARPAVSSPTLSQLP